METMKEVNEGPGPEPVPKSSNSSKSLHEDEALSKFVAKDPVLGEVIKILFGKLDETNKRLDDIQGDRRRDLDLQQDQVKELLKVEVKVVEEDKGMPLESVPPVQVQAEPESKQKPLGIALGREAVEDCLSLPKVLRRILTKFSNQELINLSLVNKLWNFEARSVLSDRCCLRARICPRFPCLGLGRFAADLQQMRVVPFTGIHVEIIHFSSDHYDSLSSESLNPSYQVILDRLPWKHLSADFHRDLSEFQFCPEFLLVKRILEDYCGVLEELSFKYSDCKLTEFFQSIFQYHNFSVLKVLKLATGYHSPYTPAIIKTMVSCVPSLEELYIDGWIKFNENVMEGSSAVLIATSGLNPLEDQFCESLIDALRTESINVFEGSFRDFNLELLNKFVPMVMQASHTTLKTLRMDLLFAVPLMCYGICLENVMELGIVMISPTVERIQPDILALVQGFDFTRVFPKLNKVEVSVYSDGGLPPDRIRAFVERGNALVRKASPDRAVNIKNLEIDFYPSGSPPPLIVLAHMFPHVKTLSLRTYYLQEFPFTLLWERHFGCLAELHVDFVAHQQGNPGAE